MTSGISASLGFRFEIVFIGVVCGLMTLSIIRILPRAFIRLVGGFIVRSIYRIRIVNRERVPAKGGALLLPNHVTFADGFFIAASCPRPVRFVMDEAFMASRAVRVFTGIFDTVAIRRDHPREAIRIVIDALKSGDLVCLFPEGQLTRTGTLCGLRRGFELIARKAGHPLVPMWCDGSWGSIFSFERGRFFRKIPYRLPYPMTLAFGDEMPPQDADLESVRQAMLVTAAAAITARFAGPSWRTRIVPGKGQTARNFRALGGSVRRRMWVNGHQIGQINALQRRQPFFILHDDPIPPTLPGLLLTFPKIFDCQVNHRDFVDGDMAACWVGGDDLRQLIGTTQLSREIVFYDFGPRALDPIYRAGLRHCPCLAVEGTVVAMSMPDPPKPLPDSEPQPGHKPGTWGKLLPGFYLRPAGNGGVRAHGPAAPPEGLALPRGSFLDAEGFLNAPSPVVRPGAVRRG